MNHRTEIKRLRKIAKLQFVLMLAMFATCQIQNHILSKCCEALANLTHEITLALQAMAR